jgi:hypothetical protein
MEIYIKDERGEKHKVKAMYVFKDGAPVHIKEGTSLHYAVTEYARLRGLPMEVRA